MNKYRNFKGFNENIFCHALDLTLLKDEIYKSEYSYSKFASKYLKWPSQ